MVLNFSTIMRFFILTLILSHYIILQHYILETNITRFTAFDSFSYSKKKKLDQFIKYYSWSFWLVTLYKKKEPI